MTHTKKGFSKNGFGCCGHHKVCDMGRNRCVYEESDPEVLRLCLCYQRHHQNEIRHQDPFNEIVIEDIDKLFTESI